MADTQGGTSPACKVAAVIDIVILTVRNNLILFHAAVRQVMYRLKI